MLGQDLGVAFAIGELLRREDRLLRFLCVFVDIHVSYARVGSSATSLSFSNFASLS